MPRAVDHYFVAGVTTYRSTHCLASISYHIIFYLVAVEDPIYTSSLIMELHSLIKALDKIV